MVCRVPGHRIFTHPGPYRKNLGSKPQLSPNGSDRENPDNPLRPGVYLYKNAEGEVIYVGKAKNLRARVRSYFQEGVGEANAKTGSLLREAVDVEYIVVDNNKEALALENNLIKQKKPRFNILLRDDKTYPYIKLTLGERFPRVYVTRRLRKDGSNYYGPIFRELGLPDCRPDPPQFFWCHRAKLTSRDIICGHVCSSISSAAWDLAFRT